MGIKIGAQVLTYGASWTDALETARLVDTLAYDYLWSHSSVLEVVRAGTPGQVADWLTPYVEAGAGSFSPQIGWPYDRETIERLVGEVKPLLDARTG